MARGCCNIRIGTSGWHYDHWLGRFYPKGLPKDKWLEYYVEHFDTVEINNTFYHLPKPQTFGRWRELAPKGFLYAVKANRYITHIKRLKDAADEIKRFFAAVRLLKKTLGPILFQLPPSVHKDLELLEAFIKLLPRRHPAVFEFRHNSWYEQATYDLLAEYNAGFCIHDLPGKQSPRIVTADTIYIRFHGTTGRYAGSYPDAELKAWADWITEQSKTATQIYAYFNNDAQGHAVRNATTLREQICT